ncbi:hypothetical protein CRYUN_Cryun07bG0109800 [Craigia yunnanensis]
MAQTNGQAKKDEESAGLVHSKKSDLEQSKDFNETETETETEESTPKRSFKLNKTNLAILVASVVIIVLIIVFSILVFSTKNPKFRLCSVATPNPLFNMRFVAEMTVKNPNFGYFSYGITNVSFAYRGKQVGQVLVPKERV